MKGHPLQWFDVQQWGVEGKGWTTPRFYQRLPQKAKAPLPDLWEMGGNPTGLSAFFETDAPEVHVRWLLRSAELDEPNMSRVNFSGIDLYAKNGARWHWAGATTKFKKRRAEECLIRELPVRRRRFRLYLPARNFVARLEIGVPQGAFFRPIPPRRAKPLVYYGSSIVHGAYSSRPGMTHPAILGRWLDCPVVNLGFSGQAKMHEPMARLLAELDARAFVIDPLPNMDPALIRERAETFLRILCIARPATPVVLVEDFPLTNAWLRPSSLRTHREKWRLLARIHRRLRGEGHGNLHYVEGKHSLGDDNEGTLDGIHPNDLGYMRLATNLFPVLKKVTST